MKEIEPYLSSIYEISKFVIDNKTLKFKEKEVIELNNKTTTTIINNLQIDNVPAISFNKDTNTITSDKKHHNLNDTSFIDKISETIEPELITQLEKAKRNCDFEY